MVKFRKAKLEDVTQIQKIEKEYYEGFSCPKEILKDWIENLSENFIIAEVDNKIVGFIFFEYLSEIKAIPFIHRVTDIEKGKYVYISECGVLDDFEDSNILQGLFCELLKEIDDNCKAIVWLTGSKSKHDRIETKILLNNDFIKKENVKN